MRNVRQELIVVSAIIRANHIPNKALFLYPYGEDIALVASINHKSHVSALYSPHSHMAICNCLLGL